MAMEYVYVLNSDVMDDDCVDEDTEPPTDAPTDWPSNEFTDDPTDETDNGNTIDNSSENADTSTTVSDNTTATPATNFQKQSTVWMSLSILFFATTIITLAGIYYFIWLYRRKTCTQSMTTSVYVEPIKHLPRLQVVNSVNNDGDHVIVGMDKL